METNLLTSTVQKIKNLELFLLHLRYREGQMLAVEGNRPLLLNDPDSAWVVYSGTVDVFSVPMANHEIAGTRTHLFRSEAGQLLMGISDKENESGIVLLVSGTPGTRVIQLKGSRLSDLSDEPEYEEIIVSMINDWVTGLSRGVFNKLLPKEYTLVEPDPNLVLAVNELTAVTPKRGVAWLNVREGRGLIVGEEHSPISYSNALLPLAPFVWWRPIGEATIAVWDTGSVLAQKLVWNALVQFHHLVLDTIVAAKVLEGNAEWERVRQKAESEQLIMENALLRLGSTLSEDVTFLKALETGHDAIWAASVLVAQDLDIELTAPPAGVRQGLEGFELLDKIAQASRIRTREVALRGEWWEKDNGPLLGFTKGNQPVALIGIRGGRGYEMVDPINKVRVTVTESFARELNTLAYVFYRPFPNDGMTAGKLLRFGLKNSGEDLRRIMLVGVGLALLRLVPPVATGYIFNTYIPQANVNGLVQVGIALIVVAIIAGLLQINQGNAVLRLQSRLDTSLQAAMWDRLLTLPIPFFRQFSAGELGTRVMGVSIIRRILSGYVFTTILTFLFTSFNLVLLFFYSPMLALLALGLILSASLFIGVVTFYDIRHQRDLSAARGGLSGLVLQLLTGIAKLRITASEKQAFALWTDKFVEQTKIYYRARQASNNLVTFNAIYPILCSLAIFAVVGYSATRAGLNTGDFLAFNLAFVQFLGAWIAMANSLTAVATTVPIYERLKPILDAKPEVDEVKITPPPLTGAIEVNHASFRYSDKSPLVLKDVSLSIDPGQFVAFVGASGSGKTTLMRLLLLFDQPEAGGVYYDGQDLSDLDAREVRRQMGVVLQNSSLMAGSIYENIVGTSNLGLEVAWEAARMVGLDKDIEEMPMKMHTVISGSGGTLSGGQRQRIMIARAIVTRPRIILFDEATSALDNKTQEIVSRSLEGLQATRIVIAHRLSTIINADKIFVFDKGAIVQSGTYKELIRQTGPFAELAKRQTV
jgi:NHLM bacteriocin system ABC transporter ATP-binding protein